MESQSRYSIVERLTKQKLDIMGAKHSLQDDLKRAEQQADNAKVSFEIRKEEIQADAERDKKLLDKELLELEQKAHNLKERMPDKERMYDEKIAAVDEALRKIEMISQQSAHQTQS